MKTAKLQYLTCVYKICHVCVFIDNCFHRKHNFVVALFKMNLALFTRFSEGKNLVIKMMNVGGRAVGRAGVNNWFPEHNSATV